jgi:protein-S-isoprenylcysteine O-methyltransferase Ste14
LLEVFLFLLATAGILYVSRASLRVPGSHGFYRLFAWEFLVALFLLVARNWFDDPFSPHQIVSWLLLLISLLLVYRGVELLRHKGKPDESRAGGPMLGFEKTTELVTTGLYRYIRHPLYSSLLFLGWGVFFKLPSWPAGLLVVMVTLFLFLTARVEERENIRYFGAAYEEYIKRTKRFVPLVF